MSLSLQKRGSCMRVDGRGTHTMLQQYHNSGLHCVHMCSQCKAPSCTRALRHCAFFNSTDELPLQLVHNVHQHTLQLCKQLAAALLAWLPRLSQVQVRVHRSGLSQPCCGNVCLQLRRFRRLCITQGAATMKIVLAVHEHATGELIN
jgi:hypothetical protein